MKLKVVITLMLFLTCCLIDVRAGDLPGREIWLPESEVKDRFYSYLIGLIQADTCGVLLASDLERVLDDYRGKTSIPFETIKDIRRECDRGGDGREISITFRKELTTPVPYSILGYHPGSVTASSTVRFIEYDIPVKTLRLSKRKSIELSDIYVFAICEGWAVVDIHSWLDKLLGGMLDDTRLVVMALFKYNGDWHGLAAGYDPSGEGRSGIFNLSRNEILFPTPRELRMLGPYFRNFVTRVKRVPVPMPPEDKWITVGSADCRGNLATKAYPQP
ncbi:MAG: hypothetical protein ABIJ00_14960 [Candidatus Eisenbacteria bacterium]